MNEYFELVTSLMSNLMCDSWIAVIQYRVDLPIHHHPNEPLVMSVQSTCPI